MHAAAMLAVSAAVGALSGASEACTSRSDLRAQAAAFVRDGFAVLPAFEAPDGCGAMRDEMAAMVDAWWREQLAKPDGGDDAVFTTGTNQTRAQARSRYFFDSSDRVHFFREAGATGDASAPPALNKVGHGLHLDESTAFGRYARSARVAHVARHVAGLVAPVLPQSMYIFKAARLGGAVTAHQDGTFLYTRPRQTVVGLWLALHDANESNGCLWARPGSHHEPLRRRFVRSAGADEADGVVMTFVNTSAARGARVDAEAFLSPSLLGRARPAADAPAADAPTRPWAAKLLRPLRLLWRRARSAAGETALASARWKGARRSEQAWEWDGVWPQTDGVADSAEDAAAAALDLSRRTAATLRARGFVPLNVRAGDLVVIAGTLDHLSLPNGSPHERHSFQLHMIEGPAEGVSWAPENWLQLPPGAEFLRL